MWRKKPERNFHFCADKNVEGIYAKCVFEFCNIPSSYCNILDLKYFSDREMSICSLPAYAFLINCIRIFFKPLEIRFCVVLFSNLWDSSINTWWWRWEVLKWYKTAFKLLTLTIRLLRDIAAFLCWPYWEMEIGT